MKGEANRPFQVVPGGCWPFLLGPRVAMTCPNLGLELDPNLILADLKNWVALMSNSTEVFVGSLGLGTSVCVCLMLCVYACTAVNAGAQPQSWPQSW